MKQKKGFEWNYKGNKIVRTGTLTEVYKKCFGKTYKSVEYCFRIDGPQAAKESKFLTSYNQCKQYINDNR